MSPAANVDSTSPSNLTLIAELRAALNDESLQLSQRYRALFALKHHACLSPPSPNSIPAIEAIASSFATPSALLKHEVAYCLGQTQNVATAPYLRDVLEDVSEDPMVRHEAAEALGALGDSGSLGLLKKWRDAQDVPDVVKETCDIAIERISWENGTAKAIENLKKSSFASIDPAPPLPSDSPDSTSVNALQATLMNTALPLFARYRAMFALRDLASPPDLPSAVPAVLALAGGFADKSALFRHEIAFVFGQLGHPASIPSLFDTLKNKEEACMVRHEAAEALGSMGDEEGVEEKLREFAEDDEQVVRESVVVALDMAEFERSGQSEYATLPGITLQH